ncbi:MAG: DUF3160 domain-containing protein [Crocinitomicaceae bacterium]
MKNLFLLLFVVILFSCSSEEKSSDDSTDSNNKEQSGQQDSVTSTLEIPALDRLMPVSKMFNKGKVDISKVNVDELTLVECRIYRNHILATKGHLFMKAELRAFFDATDYYNELMWKIYDEDLKVDQKMSKEEEEFVAKLTAREEALLKNNFIDGQVNLANLVNLYQFTDIKPSFLEAIAKNGFVITPGKKEQLFHVYEENDYKQIPNFITSDIYLQLYHMYFSYVLKSIEQESFIPMLRAICKNQYEYFIAEMESASGDTRKILAKNAAFYKIGSDLLIEEGFTSETHHEISEMVQTEVQLIQQFQSGESPFMNGRLVDYSLYKPRGHYTRKDEMKQYFKAMMWMQNAFYCGAEKDGQIKDILYHALGLKMNPATLEMYKKMDGPLTFIFGQQDNLSMLDVLSEMEKQGITSFDAIENANIASWSKKLKTMYDKKNRIKSGNDDGEVACYKVNFIPQRYLADNDILQNMVDLINKPAQRCMPQGMDMFAAFGNENATKIQLEEMKEGEKWDKYEDRLKEQTKKFSSKSDWGKTVYDSWIKMLLDMDNQDDKYPYFMKTSQWSKKNLYTGLASWAELKHDAILYGEQPMAAECGGGGPPEPYTLGYVEPNVKFWESLLKLSNKTKLILENNGLYNTDVKGKTDEIIESIEFMLAISKKELAGTKLTQSEYETIEVLGSSIEWMTLSVLEPGLFLDSWDLVQGPDKSVSVIADIYTNNDRKCEKMGILHVGTGLVNEIYAVVEIEGMLYLTKGATLSYHEFQRALNDRLTDEKWQEMLKKGERPGIPSWIKEILYEEGAPKGDEKVFYSSGC